MKKAVAKRIKVTKTGKMLRRPMAVDHFRSKKSGNKIRLKKKFSTIAPGYEKKLAQYLTAK